MRNARRLLWTAAALLAVVWSVGIGCDDGGGGTADSPPQGSTISPDGGTYEFDGGIVVTVVHDPDSQTLSVTIDHFSTKLTEAVHEGVSRECSDTRTACRCGRIRVEQQENDVICQAGDCQVVSSVLSLKSTWRPPRAIRSPTGSSAPCRWRSTSGQFSAGRRPAH